MSCRVNIMTDEGAWQAIESLPRGSRSHAANVSIREWSRTSTRRAAAARMDALLSRLTAVETDRIVRWMWGRRLP